MARARVGDREIDIRVSTVPVYDGERVVLRLLDKDSSLIPLRELGMSDPVRASFERVLREPYGLVLCSGPTGSGKTTTLYAALRTLDTNRVNVMTIEVPIEYRIPEISQTQVKPKIGMDFAVGLRHLLRQDPDVILVGETRDIETAEIAVRASLTGHLVFTTLHTNDAAGSAIRMLDMGLEPYLLAAALRAAISQRLVRRLCEECRVAVPVEPGDVAALGREGRRLAGLTVMSPRGCDRCREGYRGRLGLYELMTISEPLAAEIRAGRGDPGAIRELAIGTGMRTLKADAVDKIGTGETSIEEVLHALGRDASGAEVEKKPFG
jgi:general secretion pathway protein E